MIYQEDRYKLGAESLGRRKIISSLQKLLIDSSLEDLLAFVHRLGVQYSFSGMSRSPSKSDIFEAHIFVKQGANEPGKEIKTVRRYDGGSKLSVKSSFCDALAKFLISEDHDYHIYKGPESKEQLEKSND